MSGFKMSLSDRDLHLKTIHECFKDNISGLEMAQRFKAFAFPAEDLGSIPSTHPHGGSQPSETPPPTLRALVTHTVHIHSFRQNTVHIQKSNFFFIKIYSFIIIYKYTVAVFTHTRSGHRISLQMVVSHHVVAGN